MAPSWHFKKYEAGDTYRNSTADAFFDSDTISNPGNALVREGIQNSLDAHKIHPEKPAIVRVSLLSGDDAPDRDSVEPYFTDAWPHYRADRSGLHRDDIPDREKKCAALIFEDMDTTGLIGCPTQWREPDEGNPNDFFNFFRAEALTHKTPGERGSRGIGKATFYQASRINTLFGLTIPYNKPKRLLMGRCILRSHRLGQNDHHGDGYFGVSSDDEKGLIIPVEDDDVIAQFVRAFRLERGTETGLSVVVPWLDNEIQESTIVRAVCENYFYTILNGKLEVLVETPNQKVVLDKSELLPAVRQNSDLSDLLPTVELADWITSGNAVRERHTLNVHPASGAYSWQKSLFPGELLDTLREQFQNRQRTAIRVLVPVRKRGRGQNAEESCFDVYISFADSEEPGNPSFIREDILIADVRPQRMRGIRAVVVIDKGSLAEFLRLSENPSHTQWQKNRVKKDYIYAPSLVDFVVNSVRCIYRLAMDEDQTEDKKILADLFPKPGPGNGGNGKKPKQYVRIAREGNGFSVTPGRDPLQIGDLVEIKVAYADNGGLRSAIGRHSTADFNLEQEPHKPTLVGAEAVEATGNRIVIRVKNLAFKVTAKGFDLNRDIVVDADRQGE